MVLISLPTWAGCYAEFTCERPGPGETAVRRQRCGHRFRLPCAPDDGVPSAGRPRRPVGRRKMTLREMSAAVRWPRRPGPQPSRQPYRTCRLATSVARSSVVAGLGGRGEVERLRGPAAVDVRLGSSSRLVRDLVREPPACQLTVRRIRAVRRLLDDASVPPQDLPDRIEYQTALAFSWPSAGNPASHPVTTGTNDHSGGATVTQAVDRQHGTGTDPGPSLA